METKTLNIPPDIKPQDVCKHCGVAITHYDGRLWHDAGLIFPQYCPTSSPNGSQLHEPANWIVRQKQ